MSLILLLTNVLESCCEMNAVVLEVWKKSDQDIDIDHFLNTATLVTSFLQVLCKTDVDTLSIAFKNALYSFYELLKELETLIRKSKDLVSLFESPQKKSKLNKVNCRLLYELTHLWKSHKFEEEQDLFEEHRYRSLRSIGSKEGEELWARHFKDLDISQVSWESFLSAYQEFTETELQVDEELLLKHILDNDNTSTVSPKEFSRYLRCFSPLKKAVQNAKSLYNQTWFHNFLSVEEVCRLLSDQPVGTFLVRFSRSRYDVLVLEHVAQKGYIRSVAIYVSMPNGVTIKEDNDIEKTFTSVEAFIQHHKDTLTTPFQFDLRRKSWYCGSISTKESENLLICKPTGTFMVHLSEAGKFQFVISYVSTGGVIKHAQLSKTPNGFSITNRQELGEDLDWLNLEQQSLGDTEQIDVDQVIFPSLIVFIKANPHLIYGYDIEHVPTHKVLPLKNAARPLVILGIHEEGGDGVVFNERNIYARSIATYPQKTLGYDVICDQFYVKALGNRVVFALADGCSWGIKSRKAAQIASKVIVDEVSSLDVQNEIQDTLDVKHLLFRSFSVAHEKIIETATEFEYPGTTTLVGGMIFQMSDTQWGSVIVTVGDCKVFVFIKKSNQFVDITYGNRRNVNDPCDPGGRLGPYGNGMEPDLRNLEARFWPLEKDDILFAVSDGIHDNLDPESFGLSPNDLCNSDLITDSTLKEKIKDKSWSDLNIHVAEKLKSQWMTNKIHQLTDNQEKSSESILTALIQHSYNTTAKSRDYLDEDPSRSEPKDYRLFPGKMDHTTGVAIKVDCQFSETDLVGPNKSPNKRILQTRATIRRSRFRLEADQVVKAKNIELSKSLGDIPIPKDGSSGYTNLASSTSSLTLIGMNMKKRPKSTMFESIFHKGYDVYKKHILARYEHEDPVFLIDGPTPNQTETSEGRWVCGWGISTYPRIQGENEHTQLGDPNTTYFRYEASSVRISFAMASTSRWGLSYAQASRRAVNTFVENLTNHYSEMLNVRDIVRTIASSVDWAHDAIISERDSSMSGSCGILGGLLVKLANGNYSIVFINVGSNKLYLSRYGNVSDLTKSKIGINRFNSGGRIGFATDDTKPDTNDVEIVVKEVKEGDYIIVTTPSVYHNFDPEILGKSPSHVGINKPNWSDTDNDTLSSRKSEYRCGSLEQLLDNQHSNSTLMCNTIIDYCKNITAKSREFMEQNPTESEPRNFEEFPGKMGHASCLVFEVAGIDRTKVKKSNALLLKTQFVPMSNLK